MAVIVTGAEYIALPRAPETWLVEPLIPIGGACLLYGDAKIGKSFAAIQLAQAIQSGGEWLGFPVRTVGQVVYIQLDTPRSLWATRLVSIQAATTRTLPLCADRETLTTYPFDVLNPTHAQALRGALQIVHPIAVIIDTIRECHNVNENDSTTMKQVVSSLVTMTQPAALIVVGHARKSLGDQAPSLIGDSRGGYLVDRMDAIVRFRARTIHYTGRAVEEGSFRASREDNGLWSIQPDDIQGHHIQAILSDPHLLTQSARTKELAVRLGKSEEAARSLLRRYATH